MAQVQQLTPAQQQAAQNAKLQAANAQARTLVLSQGFPMMQQIFTQTFDPDSQPTLNIPPQFVGAIKGFLVKVVAGFTNPAGGTALTLTEAGPANVIKNVTFIDLQNYQRINTPGWHLHFLNTQREGKPFFGTTNYNAYPVGYGNNYGAISAPSTIAGGTSGTIEMYYWVPVTYSHANLTGLIYANVVNATMNLQLTFPNSAQAITATGNPFTSIFTGGNAGASIDNVTVTVYQNYIDQLPQGAQGPILPMVDMNTMYEIKQTAFTGMSVASDFNIGYSNFRHFMSTNLVYLNGTGTNAGTDINYMSFRTANYTDTKKLDPFTWAALTRQKIGTDMPVGCYYFDTRNKPIFTTQYGNQNLVVNPSSVGANSQFLVGWEMLANISNLSGAGSLAANGQ